MITLMITLLICTAHVLGLAIGFYAGCRYSRTEIARADGAHIRHEYDDHAGHLYYVEMPGRSLGPYFHQKHVRAIIDIADDGTLAGIELIDDMPPPPSKLSRTDAENAAGMVS